jgi:hypothetical protein
MSTVVLTPTHMACDHTVLHTTYPHQAVVDCHHQKIFIPPHKKYIIGHVGEFNPDDINRDETWDHLGLLLALLVAHQNNNGFTVYVFLDQINLADTDQFLNCKKALDYYKKTFDFLSKTIIATKTQRFIIQYDTEHHHLFGRAVGPYVGIGSGGMLAAGMLIGKMPLETIWEPLNKMDTQTSREHTSVALSSLKSAPLKRKT